jgi:hypothetical protein
MSNDTKDYALSLAAFGVPDASMPRYRAWLEVGHRPPTTDKLTRARVASDDRNRALADRDFLSVPTFDTWTPEMLGLVLHFMDSRIDAPHSKADARVIISIVGKRPPRFDLNIEARGWRVWFPLWHHHSRYKASDFPTMDEFHNAVRQERDSVVTSFDPAMLDYLRALAVAPVSLADIPDPAKGRCVAVRPRPEDTTIRRRIVADTFRNTVTGPLRAMLRALPPEDRALVIDRLHDAIDHAENS